MYNIVYYVSVSKNLKSHIHMIMLLLDWPQVKQFTPQTINQISAVDMLLPTDGVGTIVIVQRNLGGTIAPLQKQVNINIIGQHKLCSVLI
jgi:hypothetical protein